MMNNARAAGHFADFMVKMFKKAFPRTSKTKPSDYPAIYRFWDLAHDYLWVECDDEPQISAFMRLHESLVNEKAKSVRRAPMDLQ